MTTKTVTLLMTRPYAAAEQFLLRLSPDVAGMIAPHFAPLIEIEWLATRIDLTDVSGLILTSANGARAASALTETRSLPVFCVGEATSHAARELGWQVDLICENAKTLVCDLIRSQQCGPLLHLCGRHTRGEVAERLSEAGCLTRRRIVYEQKLLPLDEKTQPILRNDVAVVAPIFSPRTARQFVNQCPESKCLHLVALSPAVAEPLSDMAYSSLTVAMRANAASMAAEIETLVYRLCRVESGGGAQ